MIRPSLAVLLVALAVAVSCAVGWAPAPLPRRHVKSEPAWPVGRWSDRYGHFDVLPGGEYRERLYCANHTVEDAGGTWRVFPTPRGRMVWADTVCPQCGRPWRCQFDEVEGGLLHRGGRSFELEPPK